MDESRKVARTFMKDKLKKEVEEIKKALNLTERQEEVFNSKFFDKKSNSYILDDIPCSRGTLRNDLTEIYNKIYRYSRLGE